MFLEEGLGMKSGFKRSLRDSKFVNQSVTKTRFIINHEKINLGSPESCRIDKALALRTVILYFPS